MRRIRTSPCVGKWRQTRSSQFQHEPSGHSGGACTDSSAVVPRGWTDCAAGGKVRHRQGRRRVSSRTARIPSRKNQNSSLTFISHQLSAAGAVAPRPMVFSLLGVLDVPQVRAPRPSGRKPHCARHLGALATKPGEICRFVPSTLVWGGEKMDIRKARKVEKRELRR